MLTTGDVARLFHVSAQTVINWLEQGRLPFERIGKGPRRLTEQTVLRYIREIGISPEALDSDMYADIQRRVGNAAVGTVAPMLAIDPAGRIVACNTGGERLLGAPPSMEGNDIGRLGLSLESGGGNEGLLQLLQSSWPGSVLEMQLMTIRHGAPTHLAAWASRIYAAGGETRAWVLLLKET